MIPHIPLGQWVSDLVDWLLDTVPWLFDAISAVMQVLVDGLTDALVSPPPIIWIVVLALLALLPFTDDLREQGRLWWLWTCGAGIGLGLFGISYCRRRAAAIARSQEEGPADPGRPAQV